MSYTIVDRMRFTNKENEKLKSQKSTYQVTEERMKIYDDFSHIKSVDMSKEYEKVSKDKRTHEDTFWLDPNKKYK